MSSSILRMGLQDTQLHGCLSGYCVWSSMEKEYGEILAQFLKIDISFVPFTNGTFASFEHDLLASLVDITGHGYIPTESRMKKLDFIPAVVLDETDASSALFNVNAIQNHGAVSFLAFLPLPLRLLLAVTAYLQVRGMRFAAPMTLIKMFLAVCAFVAQSDILFHFVSSPLLPCSSVDNCAKKVRAGKLEIVIVAKYVLPWAFSANKVENFEYVFSDEEGFSYIANHDFAFMFESDFVLNPMQIVYPKYFVRSPWTYGESFGTHIIRFGYKLKRNITDASIALTSMGIPRMIRAWHTMPYRVHSLLLTPAAKPLSLSELWAVGAASGLWCAGAWMLDVAWWIPKAVREKVKRLAVKAL